MLVRLARQPKAIAWFLMTLIYLELIITPVIARGNMPFPAFAFNSKLIQGDRIKLSSVPETLTHDSRSTVVNVASKAPEIIAPESGGPTQPEMQAFSSVNGGNMVDLFSGDFSYSIPLLDVGGYPVTLGYRAGAGMDEEASWVGLGWNISPGAITRNLRGLPDDFNGDTVLKVLNVRENKTTSVSLGVGAELLGVAASKSGTASDTPNSAPQIKLDAEQSFSVVYNNYRGWGLERKISTSISAGLGGAGTLSGGLSIANSSMDGVSVSPHVSYSGKLIKNINDNSGMGGLTLASSYNSRSGIRSLQLSAGYTQTRNEIKNKNNSVSSGLGGSIINFFSPAAIPSINIPYTSYQFSFSLKLGKAFKVHFGNATLSGYQSSQMIAARDTLQQLQSYGYLHYQDANKDLSAYLDFNREKELPYSEKPAYPHIAVPSYTYDAFSITGEGTGGMFRAYRNDLGFVYDRKTRTRDYSENLGVDIGVGDLSHLGYDINLNSSVTASYAWTEANPMAATLGFRKDSGLFQSVYFRNPAEKSIISKAFYKAIGGDYLVTEGISQQKNNSPSIGGTNYLIGYANKKIRDTNVLNSQNVIRPERDKRTQVITYLTAREAEAGALSKYIENYTPNVFEPAICTDAFTNVEPYVYGLWREIYNNKEFKGAPVHHSSEPVPVFIPHREGKVFDEVPDDLKRQHYGVRWYGRVKAPVTGQYVFYMASDDGAGLRLNDKWLFHDLKEWNFGKGERTATANLVKGEFYEIEVLMSQYVGPAGFTLSWSYPGQTKVELDRSFLYKPAIDTFAFKQTINPAEDLLVKEKRLNSFRKADHISEITVLNNDGRRYVYGIPVYNLHQEDLSFAVDGAGKGNPRTGLVKYQHNADNTSKNMQGKDRFFSKDVMPAYAHSFLLSGILSADYSDITGNGITDDDLGDAIKFNYSRLHGIRNPFRWRTPSVSGDSASLNERLLTDNRDDQGSYVYGEKELWYMHSIESKTMIATFVLENRIDLVARDQRGNIDPTGSAKRLKEINLYNKADFIKSGLKAKPVKTVHFTYNYELCKGFNGSDSGKLTLKKVSFTYNGVRKGGGKGQNPYYFSYHSNNPSYDLKSYDRWGNFKNSADNPGATAGNPITNIEYPYALQDSAKAAFNAGAWNLDSIYLPSGGSLKVEYEADDYGWVQNKRAMQLFKIVGLGKSPGLLPGVAKLYDRQGGDNNIVFIKVPRAVTKKDEVFQYYLQGVNKLYFRLSVEMPVDNYSNGRRFEYIPCYAELDPAAGYGIYNSNTIWVRLKGISLNAEKDGEYSPLVKAATQYIRLNHPNKAFPGAETGDGIDLAEAAAAVRSLAGWIGDVIKAFESFDATARKKGFGMFIDTSRSFIRLNNPWLKKYGGGHRVKRIIIYDNWDKMTGQRPAKYGQEYTYTTDHSIGEQKTLISSGVAVYEPPLGAEENPFKQPIEYIEKSSLLGPVSLGYSEEPLGESFFPAAGVGYSKVRVRTINYKNRKSANGISETRFYTAYDFPVITERTLLDQDNKKRFKSPVANYFKINARHYLTLSQGFKIELNDMHGKIRSEGTIPETELKTGNYNSKTEFFYKTITGSDGNRRLDNTVITINSKGIIDTAAVIGKDIELMTDLREQRTDITNRNLGLNSNMFSVTALPPIWLIFTLLPMFQDERSVFRSSATSKLIHRYGIIDSVVVTDRGSKISTQNLVYDSETGDVLMTKTRNEFNDPVYHFTYPSHWAYDGMGPASKNIDVRMDHLDFREGKIQNGSLSPDRYFSSGDELLVFGKQQTGGVACNEEIATFPGGNKIWCIDSSIITGGPSALYFIDRSGKPYSGLDVSIRIVRSGRRNMFGSVGEFTSLRNPIVKNVSTGEYELMPDRNSRILAASSNQFKQFWKVEDVFAKKKNIDCLPHYTATGRIRCKQLNGANTGYQEAEEIDINVYSGEYGQSRWVDLGYNCRSCPLQSSWYVSGQVRCQVDSMGRYTGYLEREEVDTTSCGAANSISRWVRSELNCAECPQSPENGQIKDTLMKYLADYEQYRRQQYGIRTSITTPGNIEYDVLPEITESGRLMLPAFERNKTGAGFSKVKVELNNNNFCWQNGYAVEARMKFSDFPAAGEVFKLNTLNLNAAYSRKDTSLVLDQLTDNYGLNRAFAYTAGSVYGLKDSLLKDWITVKLVVLPTHYFVYLNKILLWDSTRNAANAIVNTNNFSIDLTGRKGMLDWIKVFDASGNLKYFEDYKAPLQPAMPERTFYCPTAAPDCKTAFVNYYNQRAQKNYSFNQIDSVYYQYTCRNVDVCGTKDSIENIVNRFNATRNPYRLQIQAFSNQVPVGNSYKALSDPKDLLQDGYYGFPDTLRMLAPARDTQNYLHVIMPYNFCSENGYTVEWKVKHQPNLMSGFQNFGYMQDGNVNIGLNGYANGYQAGPVRMAHETSPRKLIANGPFMINTDPFINYNRWNEYRMKLTYDRVSLYCNGEMIFDTTRQVVMQIVPFRTFTFSSTGHQMLIDWFKLYDGNGVLRVFEDFNDPDNFAKVQADYLCPVPSTNCVNLFVTYFNQQNGSAYTYEQIAALYLKMTGKVLNICD